MFLHENEYILSVSETNIPAAKLAQCCGKDYFCSRLHAAGQAALIDGICHYTQYGILFHATETPQHIADSAAVEPKDA